MKAGAVLVLLALAGCAGARSSVVLVTMDGTRWQEIFRGAETDELASRPETLNDAQGHRAVFLTRNPTFFESEVSLLTPDGPRPVALPGKVELNGMLDGTRLPRLDAGEIEALIHRDSLRLLGLAL